MSEPSLDPTFPTDVDDLAWQTIFWKRLAVMLFAQDTVFDAWKTYHDTSGNTDAQWFAEKYSGYVFGLKYQNTDAIVVDVMGTPVPTYWDKTKDGNGFCMEDIRNDHNFGGWCMFPKYSTADGSAAETYAMTAADFETLRGYWKATPVADGDPTASPPSVGQGIAYYTALSNADFG